MSTSVQHRPSEAAVVITVLALIGASLLMRVGSPTAVGSLLGLGLAVVGVVAGGVLLSRRPRLVLALVLGLAMAAAVLRAVLLFL
ncbi:uridine phosphorylase [Crossiella equi]|uniref:Uridine phosphorylase n=1 Tax=Crossiella equi TaxID=130796 RepID=A0ABS5ANU4_9PSEU|nr:hypothetical protein [Crossiella equi]MBP2478233.1 uridine phosphorylase [Crossiella equi]